MKKYYGNYLGLVVEDFDPEYKNRVKVFVPAISATLLSKVNSKRKNVTITGVGVNLLNNLDDDAYEELVRILPWAECAAPLFGGGTSMHYNRETKQVTNKNNPGGPAVTPTVTATTSPGTPAVTPTITKVDPDVITPWEGKWSDQAAKTQGDASGRSTYGKESDAHGGQGNGDDASGFTLKDVTPSMFKKIKFAAIIARRETDFSAVEAFSDANNQLKTVTYTDAQGKVHSTSVKNSGVLEEYNKLINQGMSSESALLKAQERKGDYGFYQVNALDLDNASKAGVNVPNLTGRGQTSASFLNQTLDVIKYFDYLNKERFPGLLDLIESESWDNAERKVNRFWNALLDGPSYNAGAQSDVNIIKSTTFEQFKAGGTLINRVVDPRSFNPLSLASRQAYDVATGAVSRAIRGRQAKVNENSNEINATRSSGIPGGIFSTPKINSHVWVFFNDGDPQYPVYFAQHIIGSDWSRIKDAASPGVNQGNADSANSRKSTTSVAQPGAGILEFITQHEVTAKDDNTKEMRDSSGIKMSGSSGGMFAIMTNGNIEYAVANKTTKVAGDNFLTVEGNHQIAVKGKGLTVVAEDQTTIIGDVSETAIAAAKKIKELLKVGHDRAIIQHKEPSGAKVKCPICWGEVMSEKGSLVSKLLTRAGLAVANLFGRDTVASRHVGEVLVSAAAPLKATTNRKKRKGGDCGNPNCENGYIPDFSANAKDVEETHLAYQASVFPQIIEEEQKLGVGGNQYTMIAKNCITKVGLMTNDLTAHAVVEQAIPINNGVEFIKGEGPVTVADTVPMYKTLDVPNPPYGIYELLVASKYHLKVGSRGVHIETTGNIELHGAHLEITSNYLSLGNNKGITKITGAAVQIEASKSITLGGAPTNVHIKGNAHVTANVTAQGSIYADGNVYAKRLVVPASVNKTDLSSAADYVSGLAVFNPTAAATFGKNVASKIPKHYNPVLSGLYPATGAGMSDVLVDWLTQAQMSNFFDNWNVPTGMFFGYGSGPVFTYPHIHMHHNSAHSHSYKTPDGMFVNDQEEVPEMAKGLGGAVSKGEAILPDI